MERGSLSPMPRDCLTQLVQYKLRTNSLQLNAGNRGDGGRAEQSPGAIEYSAILQAPLIVANDHFAWGQQGWLMSGQAIAEQFLGVPPVAGLRLLEPFLIIVTENPPNPPSICDKTAITDTRQPEQNHLQTKLS